MRNKCKFLVAAILAVGAFSVASAGANPTTLPVGVQGTYTYSNQGTKVTVGYSPCGYPTTNPDGSVTYSGSTPYFAHFDAKGNSGSVNIYAGSEGALNSTLTSFGDPLTAQASAVLENDAATLICT